MGMDDRVTKQCMSCCSLTVYPQLISSSCGRIEKHCTDRIFLLLIQNASEDVSMPMTNMKFVYAPLPIRKSSKMCSKRFKQTCHEIGAFLGETRNFELLISVHKSRCTQTDYWAILNLTGLDKCDVPSRQSPQHLHSLLMKISGLESALTYQYETRCFIGTRIESGNKIRIGSKIKDERTHSTSTQAERYANI
ncbi:hypothetical protein EVAR_12400_1 [Eumeta japonica]|uniref:Uncharacterized protein n=1 Tax=Eumeta variegata TaxID=151549 RepID=A0A4C1TZ81_EUMVA|nr:hypothetical protein EVAR_12400_1 [Eumeta japonica]